MSSPKASLFADLTLAELWAAAKSTVGVAVIWGVFVGIGFLVSSGGQRGSDAVAREIGFADGKFPTWVVVGVCVVACVIWPGFISSITRSIGKYLGATLPEVADFWESSSLLKRIAVAIAACLLVLLIAAYPLFTYWLLVVAGVFVGQVVEVKAQRKVES